MEDETKERKKQAGAKLNAEELGQAGGRNASSNQRAAVEAKLPCVVG